MNIIKFGKGKKCLAIIAGVSLCGLEGHGNAIAERYKNFEEEFTVYVIDRKKILPDGYSVEQMAELKRFGGPYEQVFGIEPNGTVSVSKHGHFMSRSTNDVIIVDNEIKKGAAQ